MGFHHLAFATRDLEATHAFYTEAMGFTLAYVTVAATGEAGTGWAKHAFYDTGNGELMAFWDLHDPDIADGWSAAISEGQGLPIWVNHVAFQAAALDDLEARKQRWLDHGCVVMEIDHGWCQSVYTTDPNRILVEFCTSTRAFTAEEQGRALELLRAERPPVEPAPVATVHGLKERVGSS